MVSSPCNGVMVELDSSSWCFATLSTPRGPVGALLVDSGADYHICHPDFANHGTRLVNLRVGAQGQRAELAVHGSPKQGTTLDKWTCLEKHEKELVRAGFAGGDGRGT